MHHAKQTDGQVEEAFAGLKQTIKSHLSLLVRLGHVDDDLEILDLVLGAEHLDERVAVSPGRSAPA